MVWDRSFICDGARAASKKGLPDWIIFAVYFTSDGAKSARRRATWALSLLNTIVNWLGKWIFEGGF